MGAGALFAAERDRWPEHWQVADLEREEDFLLAILEPAEELRAVIPAMRTSPADGEEQVLIGVTDRRVVLVGRRGRSEPRDAGVESIDVTDCATVAPRDQRVVPHHDGHLEFDIDVDAIARMWAHIDGIDRARRRPNRLTIATAGVGPGRRGGPVGELSLGGCAGSP